MNFRTLIVGRPKMLISAHKTRHIEIVTTIFLNVKISIHLVL